MNAVRSRPDVDTAEMRREASGTIESTPVQVAYMIAAAAYELDVLRTAAREARETMAHMWSGEPIDDDEVDRVMVMLDAALPVPPDPAA